MRSFAIVIRRAYFEAKKRRKFAKNVVVNMSANCTEFPHTLFLHERDLCIHEPNDNTRSYENQAYIDFYLV